MPIVFNKRLIVGAVNTAIGAYQAKGDTNELFHLEILTVQIPGAYSGYYRACHNVIFTQIRCEK